jgi:hypothetical protein
MTDLLIDTSTDDIYVSPTGGVRLTADVSEDAAQRLRTKLRRFLGEWFLDVRLGVPYYRDIFLKSPNLPVIRSLFSAQIAGDVAVARLESLTMDFDPVTRRLDVTFVARLVTGDLVSVDLGLSPLAAGGDELLLDDGTALVL